MVAQRRAASKSIALAFLAASRLLAPAKCQQLGDHGLRRLVVL
jgi:hypothetical protein